MFLKRLTLLVLIGLLAGTAQAIDFARMEVNLSGGHSDNVLTDSSQARDFYSTYEVKLNLYPSSKLEVGLNGDYNYYSNKLYLNNTDYGAQISFLPLNKNSKVGLLTNLKYNNRNYRENNNDITNDNFNTTEYDALMGADYLVSETFRVRSVLSYHESDFNRDEVANKNNFLLSGGFNLSLFNSNSLDLETGLSLGNLYYLPEFTTHPLFPDMVLPYSVSRDEQYSLLEKGDLNYFYYSLRFSRPLGLKSGISFTFSVKNMYDLPAQALVYGYSTGYISPWNSIYDGYTIQTSIKTYLLPGFIINFGGGYWDKDYLRTLELGYDEMLGQHKLQPTTVDAADRAENQRKIFLKIEMPLIVQNNLIEPFINFDYTNNNSTIIVYDYDNLNFIFGVSIKLR